MPTELLKILSVLAVILMGFASVVIRGGDSILRLFNTAKVTDAMSGALSGKLDHAVFDAIPRSRALDGLASGLLYAVLGDAGPQVWAGCGDWLYSLEELRVGRHDRDNILAHADVAQVVARKLSERGIGLIMLPVPDKAEQVEDQLCGIPAAQSRFRSDVWQKATQGSGVASIDVRSGWPQPGYWHGDTHWDSRGARFAADAVARNINARLGNGADRVSLTERAPRQRVGDLARVAGLADAPRWLAPSDDTETEVNADIGRSGGLLDDTPSPSIVLAGSSFSMNSGFIAYLQASVARDVAQKSLAGGGFAGALLALLRDGPDTLAGNTTVIWEWPMRSLTTPLTAAENRLIDQAHRNQ